MLLETTVHIWKEGSQYVAHAIPLDVMSSGPTPDSARLALDEAVRAFLLTVADAGNLEQVLEAMDIQPGEKLEVFQHENRIELIPVRPIREMRGFLRGIDTTLDREPDHQ